MYKKWATEKRAGDESEGAPKKVNVKRHAYTVEVRTQTNRIQCSNPGDHNARTQWLMKPILSSEH